MHVIPFYNRSLFDDVDSWFEDLLWDGPLGYSVFPARGRTAMSPRDTGHQRPRAWTATVRLTGYRPEEVKWELGADNATVKVHARHQDSHNTEDFTEVRRTVQVPDTVDRGRLEVDFTREGILVIKAPYKEQAKNEQQMQQHQRGGFSELDVFSPWRMTPWREWSELSKEMQQLQNELIHLQQQSFPGTMGSHFEQAEDGSTRLHLDFNMQGYKPEEVSVSHQGNTVVVEARQENKSEQGSSLKHFKRMFTLPENVKLDALTSKLLPNGQLRLEAPCETKQQAQQAIGAEGRDIPVKRLNKDGK